VEGELAIQKVKKERNVLRRGADRYGMSVGGYELERVRRGRKKLAINVLALTSRTCYGRKSKFEIGQHNSGSGVVPDVRGHAADAVCSLAHVRTTVFQKRIAT
jgi:hypothetical protein